MNVIFASGEAVVRTAWSATRTIPIVAVDLNADPIESGMATSFAHPGGNVTGIFLAFEEFAAKWLDLLKEMIPKLSHVAVLWDPTTGQQQKKSVERAAEQLKVTLEVLEVRSPSDLEDAFRSAGQRGVDAVLMLASPLFLVTAQKAANLAISHRLPAACWAAGFARAGGLMAYGPNLPDRGFGKLASLQARSCAERNRLSLQFSYRQNLKWLSTSRLLRLSASKFQPGCSPPPTRSSTELRISQFATM